MLWSKIPSSVPCQFSLEENSLGAHVGNSFTWDKTHSHSAEGNLKSFEMWTVWTGLCHMAACSGGEQNGPRQSRGQADWRWQQELCDVALLCPVSGNMKGISYFNIIQDSIFFNIVGNIGGRWTVGLDDLEGLFQPSWFCDSTYHSSVMDCIHILCNST